MQSCPMTIITNQRQNSFGKATLTYDETIQKSFVEVI